VEPGLCHRGDGTPPAPRPAERASGAHENRNLARPGGLYVTKNTIRSIGLTWAPNGAGNDPGNLNQHWVGSVTPFYAQLGGRGDHDAVVKTRP